MTPYHDAIRKCADRYLAFEFDDEKLRKFIKELRYGCDYAMPIPKLCRWLGYIQGVLIERGLTTVDEERNWTRQLFRPLDFPQETSL